MRSVRVLVVAACAMAGCEPLPDRPDIEQSQSKIIHGTDDRLDLYQVRDGRWLDLAENSVVALIDEIWETPIRSGNWPSLAPSVGERSNLCRDQPFRNQPSIAFCSGVLIDYDLVLTAGHCVLGGDDCQRTLFVFDYFLEGPSTPAVISGGAIYRCRDLVLRSGGSAGEDFALVQLDRPVEGSRRPAELRPRTFGPLRPPAPLTVIGFPEGAPLKVDDGGLLLSSPARVDDGTGYQTALDTFVGNSGSGVFDDAGQLIGILVSGSEDYVQSSDGCQLVRQVPNASGAETVAPLGLPLNDLEDIGWAPRDLSGEDGCFSCAQDSDCPRGQFCFLHGPDEVAWCEPDCGGGCPSGTTCTSRGCVPTVFERVCVGDDVWARGPCGRIEAVLETCRAGLVCIGGRCDSPSPGSTCSVPLTIPADGGTLRGRFEAEAGSRSVGSCGGRGTEVFFTLAVQSEEDVRIEASGVDTVLYLRSACANPSSELACSDDAEDAAAPLGSVIEATLSPGTYTVVLDTFEPESGPYELQVDRGRGTSCSCRTAGSSTRYGPSGSTAQRNEWRLPEGPDGSGLLLLLSIMAFRLRTFRKKGQGL